MVAAEFDPKMLSLWLSSLLQVSDLLTVVGKWHYGSAMPSIQPHADHMYEVLLTYFPPMEYALYQ